MSYVITQEFISKNRSGEALNPQGVVVHATDDEGATAENEQALFNREFRNASAHAFIDWDSIIQTVPWKEVAWGSGWTSNHRFLQVELCEPKTYNVAQFNQVWNRAVWLFAYLFVYVIKKSTVTKDNLMSHAEVSAKWHETTHTDPVSYFSKYGKTVDQFRNAVQEEINYLTRKEVPIVNPTYVVMPYGPADVPACEIVARFKDVKIRYSPSDVKVGESVLQIGGSKALVTGAKVLSGKDYLHSAFLALKECGFDPNSPQYK